MKFRHLAQRMGRRQRGVCREESIAKLDAFEGRVTVVGGAPDDREVTWAV